MLLIGTMSTERGARQREGLLANDLLEFKLACHLVMGIRN
jgi:hypothetical protein